MPRKAGFVRDVEYTQEVAARVGKVDPEYTDAARAFEMALRARNRSPKTLDIYRIAIRLLGEYLVEQGMPTRLHSIKREHIEAFLVDSLSRPSRNTGKPLSPGTAAVYYRHLKAFFNWLVEEDELPRSPMERIKPPQVQTKAPAVLEMADVEAMLKACEGKDFYARRDTAMITLLFDTGMRRSELAGISLEDIDWQQQVIHVVGKGNKARAVPFGDTAGVALSRYIRARRNYPSSHRAELWLGANGPLTSVGVYRAVKRRAAQAGVGEVWVHLFRHSFAHHFLEGGGQEGDLKRLGGWQSDQMVRHYGSSLADKRAQKAHRQYSPADRLKDKKK